MARLFVDPSTLPLCYGTRQLAPLLYARALVDPPIPEQPAWLALAFRSQLEDGLVDSLHLVEPTDNDRVLRMEAGKFWFEYQDGTQTTPTRCLSKLFRKHWVRKAGDMFVWWPEFEALSPPHKRECRLFTRRLWILCGYEQCRHQHNSLLTRYAQRRLRASSG